MEGRIVTGEPARGLGLRYTGAVLILLGFLGLIFRSIPYQSTENLAEIGTIKMKVTENKHLEFPPLLSGCVILAGAALLFSSRRPSA